MPTRSPHGVAVAAVLTLALAAAAGSLSARAREARQEPAGPATVKEFTVVAQRFMFTPDRIEVNQGDHVRITVKSADGTHGFAIKKMKVDSTVPKGGTPVTVDFVADKAGEYPITCSQYCGRGHSHMKAVLVVLPASGNGSER